MDYSYLRKYNTELGRISSNQKIGKNFSYPVNEKFTTCESNKEASDEEIDENADTSE